MIARSFNILSSGDRQPLSQVNAVDSSFPHSPLASILLIHSENRMHGQS